MATVRFRPAMSALVGVTLGLLLAACGGGPTSTAPQAPSDVVATPGPGYVTVTWKDNSDNETGFEVFRTTTTGLTVQQTGTSVGNVDPDTTTFVDMDIELEQEYQYSVVAKGAAGSSDAASTTAGASVPVGVDLMIGTNNRRWEDANGTIFVAYLMLPDALLTDDALTFNLQLSGPPGWNDDAPIGFDCQTHGCGGLAAGFTWGSFNRVTALAGEYTLTVTVDGQTYQATDTLEDPTFKFDRPTGITVSNATTDSVTANWTQPAGARATMLFIHRGDFGPTAVVALEDAGEQFTFGNGPFADGVYTFEVAPVNADVYNYPLRVEKFGISYDGALFTIGDAIAPACASAGEVVTIPDAELLQAVRDALGRASGDLTCLDMALLTQLDHPDGGITDLQGLQYAVNLNNLALHNNSVTDVSPLADLTALRFINLNVNEVTDVEPLRNLVELTDLHLCCTTGNITDVSPLEGMTNMTWFNISNHELGNDVVWQLLQNYPNLRGMWISNNGLTDFTPLASWPELEILQIFGSTISDFTPISDLTQLHTLEIGWSTIADITPLYGMTQLGYLNLNRLDLTDITFLEEFDQLHTLHIANNQITSLAPLVANLGIGSGDYVDARGNPLDLEDAAVQTEIQVLVDRGVNLEY